MDNSLEVLCSKHPGDLITTNANINLANAISLEQAEATGSSSKSKKIEKQLGAGSTLIICDETTELLLLDSQKFPRLRSEMPNLGRIVDILMNENVLVESLKKVPFMNELTLAQLHTLSEMCKFECFKKGESVFSEGEAGDKLYVVANGSVSVSCIDRSAAPEKNESSTSMKKRNVAILISGNFFGEMALIVNIPRMATISALEELLVVSIAKTHFQNFLKVHPSLKEKMLKSFQTRMMEMFVSCNVPFFKGLSEDKMMGLADYFHTSETMPTDTVIFRQGDPPDKFYVVIFGEVQILMTDHNGVEKELGKYGAGSYFGELALILEEGRRATIKTTTSSVLMSISKSDFQEIFKGFPDLLAEIKIRMLGSGSAQMHIEHVLAHSRGRELFKSYLEKEFSQESLQFYEKGEEFARTFSSKEVKVRDAEARHIYEEYVCENAPQQINISAKNKDRITALIKMGKIEVDIFQEAEVEVLNMLDRDNLRRFRNSSDFEIFISEIGGTYIDADNKLEFDEDLHDSPTPFDSKPPVQRHSISIPSVRRRKSTLVLPSLVLTGT